MSRLRDVSPWRCSRGCVGDVCLAEFKRFEIRENFQILKCAIAQMCSAEAEPFEVRERSQFRKQISRQIAAGQTDRVNAITKSHPSSHRLGNLIRPTVLPIHGSLEGFDLPCDSLLPLVGDVDAHGTVNRNQQYHADRAGRTFG